MLDVLLKISDPLRARLLGCVVTYPDVTFVCKVGVGFGYKRRGKFLVHLQAMFHVTIRRSFFQENAKAGRGVEEGRSS